MHEFDWIARFFAPLAHPDAALALQDDAALLTLPASQQLVITTDTLNAQVHFLPDTPPALLARKALAVNLSDLAAMGAQPIGYSLALSLPRNTDETWIEAFASSLQSMQQHYGLYLLGGDTTATDGPCSITITAFGACPMDTALRRNGAKPGDLICVTGTIGNGLLGLMLAKDKQNHPLRERYECPTPRVQAGLSLRGIATACMDVSDGLLQDLQHLCKASAAGARIDLASLPIAVHARELMQHYGIDMTDLASGGDDYELLFTLPPQAQEALASLREKAGCNITVIGTIEAEGIWQILSEEGATVTRQRIGYQHF